MNTTTSPDTPSAPRRARFVKSIAVHLDDVETALPRGRAGSPVRGRETAKQLLQAMRRAHRHRLRLAIEGSPLEIMNELKERGLDISEFMPQRVAAEHALRLLAEHTPLVVRTGRGRYRVSLTSTAR